MGCCTGRSLVKSPMDITKSIEVHSLHQLSSPNAPGSADRAFDISGNSRTPFKHNKNTSDARLILVNKPHCEAESALIIDRSKTIQEVKEISKYLLRHFLFSSLSEENILSLINDFKLVSLGPNETVFDQNSIGQNFYLIYSGRVEVVVNGQKKRIMGKGEQFGELALLHDSLRTATIRTMEVSYFWVLSRETFQQAVKSVSHHKFQENKQFIESVPILQVLTAMQKENLLAVLAMHNFNDGQKIVVEGDPGNMMYIIKQGCVICTKNGKEIRKNCH